ncbi:MAG: response regulator [Chitinophagaceae bacterium]|nr:MAG: response regulator [Chitinophagaceae bacterium]
MVTIVKPCVLKQTSMSKNKVIFLVEDDASIREMVEFLLKEDGFHVRSFANVQSFRDCIDESCPDLFIIDIMLPDGNGVDVSIELRNYDNTKQVPILLMSADHGKVDKPTPGAANGFLAKPFDIDELLQRVNSLTMAGAH